MSALQQGGAPASPTFVPVAFAVWASDPTISRARVEALDDFYHNADLIGRLPMPGEIASRAGGRSMTQDTQDGSTCGVSLRSFEAIGGKMISNGQSFAVLYPAETDVIRTALIDWGAIIAEAHDRAIYGALP